MAIDRDKLSLAAPLLSTTASVIGFTSAIRSRNGMTVATLSLCASLVWTTLAIDAALEAQEEPA